MSHTPFRKVRAKRVLEVSETPDELDFDSVLDTAEEDAAPSVLKRSLAALAVSTLSLLTVGGVVATASASSDRVDTSAVSTDKNAKDITRAVAAPDALSIEQQVQSQVAQANTVQRQNKGTLAAFAGRTSISRTAARTELSRAVANEDATMRQGTLADVNETVTKTATDAGADYRGDQIDVDMAKVKAEAGRIAEEKRKAEAKLKAQGKSEAEAKKAAEAEMKKKQAEGAKTAPAATTPAAGTVTGGGGSTPMRPGTYSVGASWGQYGSWSRWHTGQDLPAPVGTPILAVADGVAATNCGGCQGWAGDSALVLHHANGNSTLYAHMSQYTVQPGQVVKAGTVIGYVGMKGRTFGPHLHFEYYPSGTTPGDVYSAKNPVTYLLTLGVHM
ncbi:MULTISPECIES: M23 family metallopeptidase [unclassified Luteococcus]|uniref:M23 family metallopeptidase n=1 Tax=unclassified Luteococcus TaxID=2639923 RepID=UPI00313B7486